MRKKWLAITLLLALLFASLATASAPVHSQTEQPTGPALDWQKTFSGSKATWITRTVDGGYAFLTNDSLVKIDNAGDVQWTKSFGSNYPQNIVETKDGGFAYVSLTLEGSLEICKLDSSGQSQWNQTFTSWTESGSALLTQTIDNGYAVAVNRLEDDVPAPEGGPLYISALTLFKADSNGKLLWSKAYNLPGYGNTFRSIIPTDDGGIALAGSTGISSHDFPTVNGPATLLPVTQNAKGTDFCLVKISSLGTLQWNKTYGGVNDDDAYALVQSSDGGYVLEGTTESFGVTSLGEGISNSLLIKTDAFGKLEWAREYSQSAYPGYAYSLIQTSDGGLAFGGASIVLQYAEEIHPTAWIDKTDSYGNLQWSQTYPGQTASKTPEGSLSWSNWNFVSITEANDGSLLMAGSTVPSNSHGLIGQSFILKTKLVAAMTSSGPSPAPILSLELPKITIKQDGTIDPSTAPINHHGNLYEFNSNIHAQIVVKADNITIDGRWLILNGEGQIENLAVPLSQVGIDLSNVNNVKIQNMHIENFKFAISLDNSSHITVSGNDLSNDGQGVLGVESENVIVSSNRITGNMEGVYLTSCLNCEVTSNLIEQSEDTGITLENSSGNIIFGNDIGTRIYASFDELREGGYWTGGNFAGVFVNSSTNNLICANTLHDNLECVVLRWTTNTVVAGNNMTEAKVAILGNSVWSNQFYMNNFVNSLVSQFTYAGSDASEEGLSINTTNAWDNGQTGNYWSNYQQTYPNAQQQGSSGTWSTHYVIAPNNTDNFPLINPISADAALALSRNLISAHLPSAGLSPILPALGTPTPEATYAGQTSTAKPASEPMIIAAVLAAAIILVVGAAVELRRRANRGRREGNEKGNGGNLKNSYP